MPTIFPDNFNSYNDGDLNAQGGWVYVSGSVISVQGTTVKEGAKAIQTAIGAKNYYKTGTLLAEGRITIYLRNPTITYIPIVLQEGASEKIVFGLDVWNATPPRVCYVDNTPTWISLGEYTLGTWVCIEVEWRSTPAQEVRYRYNEGAWTAWMAPYTNWTNGVDTVAIKGDATASDDISYVDYIAENPYVPAVGRSYGFIF